MSDKRQTPWTPVVVGVVVALLGILVGFYVADNARQQLADAQQQASHDDEASPTNPPYPPQEGTVEAELPPLDPIVEVAPPPVVADTVPPSPPQGEPGKADVELPPAVAHTDTAPPNPSEEEAGEAAVDDFEPVTPEELEQEAAPDTSAAP